MRWSSFPEMDSSVRGRALKHLVLVVEEWYGLENLSSVMLDAIPVRQITAVDSFTKEPPFFTLRSM